MSSILPGPTLSPWVRHNNGRITLCLIHEGKVVERELSPLATLSLISDLARTLQPSLAVRQRIHFFPSSHGCDENCERDQ